MNTPASRLLTGFAGSLMVGAGILIYLAWELTQRGLHAYNTAIYALDDADEWRYTACSRLVLHGYSMFDQVFSAQPPLLFVFLSNSMRLFGDSISGARWIEIFFGLVALLSAGIVARRLEGGMAGGICVLILAISPAFLVYSRAIEAEMPMAALATLSLAILVTGDKAEVRVGVLAGLALAAAILTKLFATEVLAPALWWILTSSLSTRGDVRKRIPTAVAYVAAAAVPVVLDLAFFHRASQWQQVVAMHSKAASASIPDLTLPLTVLQRFFALDAGLSLLAAAGLLVLLWTRQWREGGFLVLWVVGGALMLLLFRPLFPHHPPILLPGLAVTAAAGLAQAGKLWRDRRRMVVVPVAVAVLAYFAFLPRLARDDRHVLLPWNNPGAAQLAAYLDARTGQNQIVATDNLLVADEANRFVPPPLCDPSNVRLHAGYLTASDLIAATRDYRAAVVLPGPIFEQVPAYIAWVRGHYHPVSGPSGVTAFVRSGSSGAK